LRVAHSGTGSLQTWPNRTSLWHFVIKTASTNIKERILKIVKLIKITADFSRETVKARKGWSEVCQALKENNFSPKILYPAKLSFKINGGIKVFHNKQELKQCMATKPPLQKILQGILHT
jgi:hypothetical protein